MLPFFSFRQAFNQHLAALFSAQTSRYTRPTDAMIRKGAVCNVIVSYAVAVVVNTVA